MRLLIIGQAPSRETEGKPAFTGKCGRFLAELLGTTQQQMLEVHDFLNILEHYPGKVIGGDRFPLIEARSRAWEILPRLWGRTTVLLGRNVASAFQLHGYEYARIYAFSELQRGLHGVQGLVAIVPHPSGVNRFYNLEGNRVKVSKFLKELAAV